MLEIIYLLIIAATIIVIMLIQRACKHEWEIIKTVKVDTDGFNDYDRIYLRCKKCGSVKCKDMK